MVLTFDRKGKEVFRNTKYNVRIQENEEGELQVFLHKIDSQGEVPTNGYTMGVNYISTHYLKDRRNKFRQNPMRVL